MYCSNCGKEIEPDSRFCPYCGNQVNGGTNQSDSTSTQYYNPNQYNSNAGSDYDQSSTGLNILSCLIPLVGFILFLVYHSNEPIKAKACGKWALIGFTVALVLMLLL